MPLMKALKSVRQKNRKPQWRPAWIAIALGLTVTAIPARSECQSPSAAAGATSTTVYRCPEAQVPGMQNPVNPGPDKTTVVERGSADIPWFTPQPTRTADPLIPPQPKAPAETKPEDKEVVVEIEPVPLEKPQAAPAKTKTETAGPEAKPETAKPKTAKAKRAKVKLGKAKHAKARLAHQKRTKTKPAIAETKAKTRTAKAEAEAEPEQVKTEPAKADDKVITWTRKDMPLGSRVKNWLGF